MYAIGRIFTQPSVFKRCEVWNDISEMTDSVNNGLCSAFVASIEFLKNSTAVCFDWKNTKT